LANVATLCVAATILAIVVYGFLARRAREHRHLVPTGTKLSLRIPPAVRADRVLILVLSSDCDYCSQDAPFYQQISKAKTDGTFLVAVLPQELSESRRYLQEHGIVVDQIVRSSPGKFGARGTPTLILARRDGTVLRSWAGRLPNAEKSAVIELLSARKPIA